MPRLLGAPDRLLRQHRAPSKEQQTWGLSSLCFDPPLCSPAAQISMLPTLGTTWDSVTGKATVTFSAGSVPKAGADCVCARVAAGWGFVFYGIQASQGEFRHVFFCFSPFKKKKCKVETLIEVASADFKEQTFTPCSRAPFHNNECPLVSITKTSGTSQF